MQVRALSWPACVVAGGLLIGSGFGFRQLAVALDVPRGDPLPAHALASLPLELGQWSGSDVELDPRLRAATDADQVLNRRYVHRRTQASVGLFVSYGTRIRELAPHRPEVCYPAAGWALERVEPVTLTSLDSPLPARVLTFHRGLLDDRRLLVVNYYVSDGRVGPDVSLLRTWGARPRHMLQVQVSVSASPWLDAGAAGAAALEFAAASAPALRAALGSAQ